MNNGIAGQARWIPVEQSIAPACLKAILVAVTVLADCDLLAACITDILFEDTFCKIFRKCPFFFGRMQQLSWQIFMKGFVSMIVEGTPDYYYSLGKRNL